MYSYNQYIKAVQSGKIQTGELVKLAIKRHLKDLDRQGDADFPYYFDEKQGQRFINFAHKCKHWKGDKAKQYIELEPWQQFYIISLFGWLREGGLRRFRTAYMEIGRKNGKTSLCAVKALAHLKLDNEAGAQVYFAATKEDQARIGFRDVQEIIKATPGLGELYKIYTKSVTFGNSFIKPLGSDSDTSDGLDPSYGIIDEYHAHPTSGMLSVLESGMASRRSPLIDIITTAGFNQQGPCYTEARRTSIEILKGIKQDETHLALIYSLDEDDDWKDEENWIKANPNLGVSVRLDFLRDRFQKAINEGGSKEVDFKTKNLNIWTEAEKTWISDENYMKCVTDDFTGGPLDIEKFKGKKCRSGLDLASVRDTCSWVLVFKDELGNYKSVAFFFLPEKAMKDRQAKGIPYQQWVKEGYIILTPGDATDYDFIRAKINEVAKIVQIESIEYDRYNSSQLVIDLCNDGFKCNPFGQGFVSMSGPTKTLEKLIYNKQINPGTNPVMRWMFSNISIKRDPADNIKITKESSKEKVDGPVSLVMGIGGWLTPSAKASPYETRGVRTL